MPPLASTASRFFRRGALTTLFQDFPNISELSLVFLPAYTPQETFLSRASSLEIVIICAIAHSVQSRNFRSLSFLNLTPVSSLSFTSTPFKRLIHSASRVSLSMTSIPDAEPGLAGHTANMVYWNWMLGIGFLPNLDPSQLQGCRRSVLQ